MKITCTPLPELPPTPPRAPAAARPAAPFAVALPVAEPLAAPRPTSPLAAPLTELFASDRHVDGTLRRVLAGAPATPTQLLALQADVFRHAQQLELASRLVDKLAGAVKQTLQTQL